MRQGYDVGSSQSLSYNEDSKVNFINVFNEKVNLD